MRFAVIAAFASAVLACPALAAPALAAPALATPGAHAGQACAAPHGALSRVALATAGPADCCAGRTRCAQFLSTATAVRPARRQRT